MAILQQTSHRREDGEESNWRVPRGGFLGTQEGPSSPNGTAVGEMKGMWELQAALSEVGDTVVRKCVFELSHVGGSEYALPDVGEERAE